VPGHKNESLSRQLGPDHCTSFLLIAFPLPFPIAAPFLPTTEYGYRGGELLITIVNGDTQPLTRFVTNLYYGALQRGPTSQKLTDGINQLAAAGATSQAQLLTVASQLARSLFTSTQLRNCSLSI